MIFGQRSVSLALFGAVLLSIRDDTDAARTAAADRANDRDRQLISNVRTRKLSKGSSSSAGKGSKTGTEMARMDSDGPGDVWTIVPVESSSTTVTVNVPTSEQPKNTANHAHKLWPGTISAEVPSSATHIDATADENDASDNDGVSDIPHPLVIIQENTIYDDKNLEPSPATEVGELFDTYDADGNGVIDRDEFLDVDDASDEQLPGITKNEDDKPLPALEIKSRIDGVPPSTDKNRVSTFHTGEEFQLENGTFVSCNWPARRRPERRCEELSADGRLVKDICPDACASVIVKRNGENKNEDAGNEGVEDNGKVPTPNYDDGL
mmetsp:Transcript_26354/g.53518  ORF Transcript_26354/g.53518 Transcript_26354/m.53518 type:complete len:323 (+) Transcript_26354:127-1095(+)